MYAFFCLVTREPYPINCYWLISIEDIFIPFTWVDVIACIEIFYPLHIQLGSDYCTPFDFWIYVLVSTAQTTKGMKTNNTPLKSPIKLQQEMQKKILNFPKFVGFLGHFLKKQCFWKMGVAGIKQLPCPSQIASFSRNLNGEALLKVSLKNIDLFQKYKALKSKVVKKAQFHKENGIKN